MKIINSAKALIIKDQHLALLKIKEDNIYYVLPGGSQKSEELLTDTVKRECLEEIGNLVQPKELLFVSEGFREGFHRVDFTFFCDCPTWENSLPEKPDEFQSELIWMNIADLHKITIYPKQLSEAIKDWWNDQSRIYLGEDKD